MLRKFLTRPNVVTALLILQVIPLLMMPPSSYDPTSQEWWLPVLLAIFLVVGIIQLVIRRSTAAWPWYLVSFSQGFNVISRLMLFMPHASKNIGGVAKADWLYIVLSLISILLSYAFIVYSELPDVRMSLYSKSKQLQGA
jgi:hypothetical protein